MLLQTNCYWKDISRYFFQCLKKLIRYFINISRSIFLFIIIYLFYFYIIYTSFLYDFFFRRVPTLNISHFPKSTSSDHIVSEHYAIPPAGDTLTYISLFTSVFMNFHQRLLARQNLVTIHTYTLKITKLLIYIHLFVCKCERIFRISFYGHGNCICRLCLYFVLKYGSFVTTLICHCLWRPKESKQH